MKLCEISGNIIAVIAINVYIICLLGNFRPMLVMSPSMEPALGEGLIIIGKGVDEDTELMIGDVCTYETADGEPTITHRIVRKTAEGYIFKGDNNSFEDPLPVPREKVRYRIIFPQISADDGASIR